MKSSVILFFLVAAMACSKSELVSEYTGNETTYALQQGSAFAVSGTITFKERKDGKVTALVTLTGTHGEVYHPVHMHMGDITKAGSDVSLLLNPVFGKTGKSELTFDKLSDESPITYNSLINLQACIKVHLSNTGPDRDVILAAGNIGSAVAKATGGRLEIGVCKSE